MVLRAKGGLILGGSWGLNENFSKLSPLKPPGGYEQRPKGGLIFRGLGGLPPPNVRRPTDQLHLMDARSKLLANGATKNYITEHKIIFILSGDAVDFDILLNNFALPTC